MPCPHSDSDRDIFEVDNPTLCLMCMDAALEVSEVQRLELEETIKRLETDNPATSLEEYMLHSLATSGEEGDSDGYDDELACGDSDVGMDAPHPCGDHCPCGRLPDGTSDPQAQGDPED